MCSTSSTPTTAMTGVVIDAIRYLELWRTGPDQFGGATLHRWTLRAMEAWFARRLWTTTSRSSHASTTDIRDFHTASATRSTTRSGRRTDPSPRPPRRHDRHHLGRTRTHPKRSRPRTRQPRRRRTRRLPPQLRLRRQLRDQRAGDPARRRTNLSTRRNGLSPATRPVRLPRQLDPGQPVNRHCQSPNRRCPRRPRTRVPEHGARGVADRRYRGIRVQHGARRSARLPAGLTDLD